MDRAREKARNADLILYVADSTIPFDQEDRDILESLQDKKVILLLNKSDLEQVTREEELRKQTSGKYPVFSISVRENLGKDGSF